MVEMMLSATGQLRLEMRSTQHDALKKRTMDKTLESTFEGRYQYQIADL